MHVVARGRHFLARNPWVYWAAVLSLTALVALTIHRQVSLLEETRDRWRTTRTVLVADTALRPGDQIAVSTKKLPLAAVPDSAIEEVPGGSQLRQRVAAGEIIVETDLTNELGPAARAELGTVVVGLTDPLSRQVVVGLVVQIVAEGIVLAAEATVVETIDEVIFVAVPEREAPAIAAAAHSGLASLLYLP